jgi:hypothetical protein
MTRQQRWWIWLCVAAVMGFQALGLVHRTLHGSPVASSRLAVTVAAIAAAASEDGSTPSFGHAAGTPDCQLLDQLSHVPGPIVQASAWAVLPPDMPTGMDQPHDAVLAQQWRKSARGPPRA